jgi:hypothetical protein
VSLQEQTAAQRVLDARARFVVPGLSTPRLAVARAEGARIEDADRGLEILEESLGDTTAAG